MTDYNVEIEETDGYNVEIEAITYSE